MTRSKTREVPGWRAALWSVFVARDDVSDQPFVPYYLGRRPRSLADVARCCSEMLSDAVSVGAIILPPSLGPDEIAVEPRGESNSLCLCVHRPDGKHYQDFLVHDSVSELRMGQSLNLLRDLFQSLDELIYVSS